jgi:hypothetical protein
MQPHRIRRLIRPLFLGALAVTATAWFFKGGLVGPEEVRPVLLQTPQQEVIEKEPFSFEYKGKECRVEPVASYEQWGLVVSHNNIHSVADIYHDSTSVDTKDLCVIWGTNLESTDYQQVEFKSGPWTCYFSYSHGVNFHHNGLGNNHLITDDPAIRRAVDRVRVGDQVHLKGMLVNYQMEDWREFWRRTSITREDNGCEVVYLQEVDVLRRGTPGWYALFRLGWISLLFLPLAYLALMWMEAGREDTTTLGRL